MSRFSAADTKSLSSSVLALQFTRSRRFLEGLHRDFGALFNFATDLGEIPRFFNSDFILVSTLGKHLEGPIPV